MQHVRTIAVRHRVPSQLPKAMAAGGTSTPPSPLSWCQRLAQWWARPSKGHAPSRPWRYADDWDAHLAYVQPRPPDYPLDLVARTWGYDLRMAIYHLML